METEESIRVREMIKKRVPDWDDEVVACSRFKAFSGQRSDWEGRYFFWRDLILSVATQVQMFLIRPSQLKNHWFVREGGLTPLCLDHVLSLMYDEGEILRSSDLIDPTSGQLSYFSMKIRNLVGRLTTPQDIMVEDYVIVTTVLKDKAAEVVKLLAEDDYCTASCIVTMRKFQSICGGPKEASVVLSYLSGCRKARYLSISKQELLEGVKVSLSSATVCSVSSLDYDVLHLISTREKLKHQLDMIDRRCEISRKSALASWKSGDKKVALRHAREMKMITANKEKWAGFLSRVEEVISVIADAESTKTVSEAIKIGARAIKQSSVTIEEVRQSLEELEETIDSHKQVESALESAPSSSGIEDEDIEDEFEMLELELESEIRQLSDSKYPLNSKSKEADTSGAAESFIDAFLSLRLADGSTGESAVQDSKVPVGSNKSKELEAA